MKIIYKEAENMDHALVIAQELEDSGVSVFSITYDGPARTSKSYSPESKFIVWAKDLSDKFVKPHNYTEQET